MLVKAGIWVGFDRFGDHSGYARHPDSHTCAKRSGEQRHKVAAFHKEASRRGGKVILLSLDEFDGLILRNSRANDRAPADGEFAAC